MAQSSQGYSGISDWDYPWDLSQTFLNSSTPFSLGSSISQASHQATSHASTTVAALPGRNVNISSTREQTQSYQQAVSSAAFAHDHNQSVSNFGRPVEAMFPMDCAFSTSMPSSWPSVEAIEACASTYAPVATTTSAGSSYGTSYLPVRYTSAPAPTTEYQQVPSYRNVSCMNVPNLPSVFSQNTLLSGGTDMHNMCLYNHAQSTTSSMATVRPSSFPQVRTGAGTGMVTPVHYSTVDSMVLNTRPATHPSMTPMTTPAHRPSVQTNHSPGSVSPFDLTLMSGEVGINGSTDTAVPALYDSENFFSSPSAATTTDDDNALTDASSPSRFQERQTLQPPPADDPEAKDLFLLKAKRLGMSYREIKKYGRFKEAESTLRGRFRTITKTKQERVRKPVWKKEDVSTFSFVFSCS